MAGNNSHYHISGVTYVGTPKEPSMLHAHIICRGDPNYKYIGDVPQNVSPPLRSVIPGELFDMRNGKIKWLGDESKQVASKLNDLYDFMKF